MTSSSRGDFHDETDGEGAEGLAAEEDRDAGASEPGETPESEQTTDAPCEPSCNTEQEPSDDESTDAEPVSEPSGTGSEPSLPSVTGEPDIAPSSTAPPEQAPSEQAIPQFGAPAECVPQADWELDPVNTATALAHALWGTAPDEELLERAATGLEGEQLGELVEWMLGDERAAERLSGFASWWFSRSAWGEPPTIQKDPEQFPQFDAALEADMRREAELFTRDVLFSPSGTSGVLLTAPYTFATPALAELYGQTLDEDSGFVRLELPPSERTGLFTQTLFLTSTTYQLSDAPRRGFHLRDRLLCSSVPALPPGLNFDLTEPPTDDALTTRQVYESMLADPVCNACHTLGTAMGYAFENYDALGQYRTEDNGQPVDASAYVAAVDGVGDLEFNNAVEMMPGLAALDQVQQCFSQQWLGFLLNRPSAEVASGFPAVTVDTELGTMTLAEYASTVAECARTAQGDYNLYALTVAQASGQLLTERTFACGSALCLLDLEVCERHPMGDRCLVAATNDGCEGQGGNPSCSCEEERAGAIVLTCE